MFRVESFRKARNLHEAESKQKALLLDPDDDEGDLFFRNVG
jgi:hypothetical protein